jgi:hypothetical protein
VGTTRAILKFCSWIAMSALPATGIRRYAGWFLRRMPRRPEEDEMFRFIPGSSLRQFALAALLLAACAIPAGAAPSPLLVPCTNRAAIVELLDRHYGEQRRGLGLTVGGQILEIFVSRDGHWSALLTYADGKSCLIAAGEDWLDEPPARGEQS